MNKRSILVSAAAVLALGMMSSALFLAQPAIAQETGPAIICLDPGHGSSTGTYNARHRLTEDEFNLDIAFRLKALLEGAGYRVEMTRTDNTNIPKDVRYTYCNKVGADLLISIHANGSPSERIDGTLVLYYYDDKPLAQAIYDALYPALSSDPVVTWRFRDLGVGRFDAGILMCSEMPGVLVEPVFITNNSEAQLLLDTGPTSRRQAIAQAMFDGINHYYSNGGGAGQEERDRCPYTFPDTPSH